MNRSKLTIATLFSAAALLAQGPPPGPSMGPPPMGPPPGGFGFGPAGPGGGPGAPDFHAATVTGAPYSAVETSQSTQTLADGTTITHSETTKLYRDSLGRTRTERTMTTPDSKTHTMVSIVDPVSGYETRLDADRSTADRTALPTATGHPRTRPAPPASAPTPEVQDLGSRSINGLTASGTRTTLTIPANTFGNSQAIQTTREVWTSPDLQIPVQVTTTDPRFGTSTRQLGSITRAEPDAALFQVPSNYAVTTHDRPTRGPNP